MKTATKATPAPAANDTGVLATAVRRLRNLRGLTLVELSTRTGISQSALSKIENGHLSPTYEKVVALANGFEVDVSELFTPRASAAPTGRRGITRDGQGVFYPTAQYGYEMLCSDISGKQFMPLKATIKARTIEEFSLLPRHEGEEFFYVLEGTVLLHSDFYQPLRLVKGDSCYFDSTMGHALLNGGEGEAEVLWVCSRNIKVPMP